MFEELNSIKPSKKDLKNFGVTIGFILLMIGAFLFIREKDWSPSLYTKATNTIEAYQVVSASYEIYRVIDEAVVIPYGTGSTPSHTMLSHDVSGNYFDLDMTLLEPGYAYGLKFAFYDERNQAWNEQHEVFKFRVEDYEY